MFRNILRTYLILAMVCMAMLFAAGCKEKIEVDREYPVYEDDDYWYPHNNVYIYHEHDYYDHHHDHHHHDDHHDHHHDHHGHHH